MLHRYWRLLACLLFAVRAAPAAEGPAHVSLRWSAPDECPDDVQLVHDVELLLGESLFDAAEQELTVHAVVRTGDAGGYSAALHFSSAQGEEDRYIEHPRCERLTEAVALMVALAIDPDRVRATQSGHDAGRPAATSAAVPVAHATQHEEQGTPTPNPIAPSASSPASSDAPRQSQPAALRGLRLGLHGSVGAGSLPNFGAGLDAVLGWHRRAFRAELLGRYWAMRRQDVRLAPHAALDLQLATVGARVCWQPQLLGEWRVAACAGADVGDMHGDGVGLQNQHARDARYTDLAGGMQVAYARGHLLPEAGFEFLGAVERPSFGISKDSAETPEFQPAAWGFVVSLGLSLEL